MLDVKAIRRDPEPVLAALARRRDGSDERLRRVLELDERRRALLPEAEGLRAEQKRAGGEVAKAKQAGEDAAAQIAALSELKARRESLDTELQQVEAEHAEVLATVPNPPDPDAADADTVLRTVGDATKTGLDHLALAGGMIDMEAGAAVAGSRFAYLKGDLVMLELALVRWTLELARSHGHEPVVPPVLVREQALFGTGFLPDTEQQIYRLADDPLYLAGTSEVALASLHAEQVLEAGSLPIRYAGFSPCFRREAGAAGRDTRGIFRVHQFDKVELFSFVEPDMGADEHERLLAIEEEVLQALEIPYRVVNIAVDDLGGSAAKKYDCEAWLPGQERYRELTSTSNTTDFQARRLNIRYRARPPQDGLHHVHTLNGTAVAVGRTLIALLENGQQEDGSVAVPEVLHAWGAPARVGGVS
jgi:seryl-tRNA synthetase